ncbi:MAG: iron ABC transporter permease [Planctomycetota bacterium]|nr:iron ABC transporter permease [Planctomycetota bacterium]
MTVDNHIGTPPAKRRLSPWLAGMFLCLALVVVASASLASGYLDIGVADIAGLFRSKAIGSPVLLDEAAAVTIWEVRLPRILTALVCGAALALSGAVFQGLLLNPLADPYTLGVSSGAAFGASGTVILGLLFPGAALFAEPWAMTLGAFAAASLTLAAVILLAQDADRRLSPTNLILAGVILSAILSAAISFVKYLAGDQVESIVFWLLGSFQARTWADAGVIIVFFIPALFVSLWSAVDLNIMTMGARAAETLGVNTKRVRLSLLAAVSLAAAAAVSVSGVIGFVGLIVPHLVRILAGPDHRSLLPLSALGGALLLSLADMAVRSWLPGEIPVGVLTALLAGPAFLVIFRKRMAGRDNG